MSTPLRSYAKTKPRDSHAELGSRACGGVFQHEIALAERAPAEQDEFREFDLSARQWRFAV
jgi:hypothetical protein